MGNRKQLFLNLITIAYADGIVNTQEKQALYKLGVKYGYSQLEIDEELQKKVVSIHKINNLTSAEKTTQVLELFRIALADGKIDDSEVMVLHRLLYSLGYSKEEVNELISVARKAIETLV